MDCDRAIVILREHEAELRAAGIAHVSICGSVACDEATSGPDVDVVVRLTPEASRGGFAYFGRLDDLSRRLEEILGCSVDLVAEAGPPEPPAPKRRTRGDACLLTLNKLSP
jgi:hypothetical protein